MEAHSGTGRVVGLQLIVQRNKLTVVKEDNCHKWGSALFFKLQHVSLYVRRGSCDIYIYYAQENDISTDLLVIYNKSPITKYNKSEFHSTLPCDSIFIVQHEYFKHFSLCACIFRSSVDWFKQETKISSGRCVACEMKVWTAVIQHTEIWLDING